MPVSNQAKGCNSYADSFYYLSNCSTTNSESLGNNTPPFTFDSGDDCTQLDVIEGYRGGESVFRVEDNETSLGNTSDIPLKEGSNVCNADPDACFSDPGVTKGSWTLGRGKHSLRIFAVRLDKVHGNYGEVSYDRGF
jgi:hypothetical protein